MSEWIKSSDKTPPACCSVLVYRHLGRRTGSRIEVYLMSTHPKECVEDDSITHWMPLPPPPEF